MTWQNGAATQYEAALEHWATICVTTTSPSAWEHARRRMDALWRAMGYAAASPACRLADEKMVFPAVRAALSGNGKGGES
jgi:hypothetical protein